MHLKELEELKKVLNDECKNLLSLSQNLYRTEKNSKFTFDEINRDFKQQVNQLQKIKKNFSMLENHSNLKITCPSEYFDYILKDTEFKIDGIYKKVSFISQILESYEDNS